MPLPQVLKNVRYRSGKPLENVRGAFGHRGRRKRLKAMAGW